ncbi:hypothetical protein CVAR21S_02517 [Corynebacterium variabile]
MALNAVDRDVQRLTEGRTGGHADPQAGERAGAGTDHDGVQVGGAQTRLREAVDDVRGEHLHVPARVELGAVGEGADGVFRDLDHSGDDIGGGRVDRENMHDHGFYFPRPR